MDIGVKDWFLLTGSSASGKTTLLRMLFGEIKPNFGYVEKRKGLRSIKIEHEMLIKKKTIAQSLKALGHKLGLRGDDLEGRINALAQKFNLMPYLNQNILTLSESVRQLAALVQAFLMPLDLIAFDEPLVFLTPSEIRTFLHELERFHEIGVAIVIVAADGYHFKPLASRIYELTYANLKLIDASDFVDLMRPHLIFKPAPYAENLPDYLLKDTRILRQDPTILDLVVKNGEVDEITMELIRRGYSLHYLRLEII